MISEEGDPRHGLSARITANLSPESVTHLTTNPRALVYDWWRGWPTSRGLYARVTANLSPESMTDVMTKPRALAYDWWRGWPTSRPTLHPLGQVTTWNVENAMLEFFLSSYFMVKHKYKSMYSIPLVQMQNKKCFKRTMLGEFRENTPFVPFPTCILMVIEFFFFLNIFKEFTIGLIKVRLTLPLSGWSNLKRRYL